MVLRQARLIALLLLAAILAAAVASLWLGAGMRPALWMPADALFWTAVYAAAARVKRWRRNIVRAGNVFAISWVGTLAMILERQVVALAQAAGHPVDGRGALAVLIGGLLLLRANQLPKSRPAWFNGVTLPPFAPDPAVWRRIHRASAFRLVGIALFIFGALAVGPPGSSPLPFAMALLVAELVACSLHGLWLSRRAPPLVSHS